MNPFEMLMAVLASLVALVVFSFIAEALRTPPDTPEKLPWAPDIPIRYLAVDGVKLRYIKTGAGRNLVLLHTLRTQLDLFQSMVLELAKCFTVYAIDYPGHGYSDIPNSKYDADFFVHSVEGFLDVLDLRGVVLCGVSIGGAISLIVGGRGNPRVARVVAINPYDYFKGRGMSRSSLLGWMITMTSRIPVLGETAMRLRNFIFIRAVLQGGVANSESIPPALLKEMYLVGNRPGHYRAFISLLRSSPSWETATEIYPNIKVPICLIWGNKDWSTVREREHHRLLLPGVLVITIPDGGHFLPFDRPKELQELIVRFGQG